jgi:fimbrial chaperone protein
MLLAGLAAGTLVPRHAQAALSFLPVQIEVPPGPTATTLSIANSGSATTLQARPFAWSQPDSTRDSLTPTPDLELSPPFFRLARGGVQLLRLVFPTDSTSRGRYFRVLLDELPPPGQTRGVRMVLRISLPAFMAATAATAKPRLVWSAQADGVIEARNTGEDWSEVTALAVLLPGGRRSTPQLAASSPYLLPGAARQWVSDVPLRPGSVLHLTGTSRTGPFDLSLAVGA